MPKEQYCESCYMPFHKDTGHRESDKYCSLCYSNGKLNYEGDLKGFQRMAYKGMIERGMNPIKAKFFAFMVRFAPRWKN